jgi:uncharacterized membrane protein (DUF4010 family)
MTVDPSGLMGLFVAMVGGAAVGLERQWSGHADGPLGRFAGLRTFTLIGGVAGMSGLLWDGGYTSLATVLVAAIGALTVAAYVAASGRDVDATTEVAAVVVLAAGFLAGVGGVQVASAVFAITSLVLVEKSQLHAMVARLDDVGLRAGVRFAVMAIVVLPLLPEGPMGSLGLRPRAVWLLVLFFSGISFAGYIAQRLVGRDHGYWVAGLLGGLVSSTSVTLTFARLSRTDSASARALATGAIAANAVLYPRVLLAATILNPNVTSDLGRTLVAPFLVACIALARMVGSHRSAAAEGMSIRNPLQVGAALQMAATFQIALVFVDAIAARWGSAGLLATAAMLGATDVDALTMSMARLPTESVEAGVAARAIGVGVLANTLVKAAVALVIGEHTFRVAAGGTLVVMAATLAATLVAGW